MSVASFIACVRSGKTPTRSECLDACDVLSEPVTGVPLGSFFDAKARWSLDTFGPGDRLRGILAHIRKELGEIEASPADLEEWVDVVLLAMDGAWRVAGADGAKFTLALFNKHQKNLFRDWPDWRTAPTDRPTEHIKTLDEKHAPGAGESAEYWRQRAYDESAEAKRWAERVKILEERLARITSIASGRGAT